MSEQQIAPVIGISISPARLVPGLAVGAALVSALGLLGQWLKYKTGLEHSFGFVGQFDPDGEGNFSTWYSSTLLLCAAAMFETVARQTYRLGRPHAWNWRLMALLLLLMSCDETAQAHEMLVGPLRSMFHTGGLLHFTWVIPGAALPIIVLLANVKFLRSLPPTTCKWMLLGAGVYLSGALVLEMLDGWYLSHFGETYKYSLLTSLEESLEMAGTVLLTWCAATHLNLLKPTSFTPRSHRRKAAAFYATSENSRPVFRRETFQSSGR
jgi:hypothetical protein